MITSLSIFGLIMALFIMSGLGFVVFPVMGLGFFLVLLPLISISLLVTHGEKEEFKNVNYVDGCAVREFKVQSLQTASKKSDPYIGNVIPLFKDKREIPRPDIKPIPLGSVSVSLQDNQIQLIWVPSCDLCPDEYAKCNSQSPEILVNKQKDYQRDSKKTVNIL